MDTTPPTTPASPEPNKPAEPTPAANPAPASEPTQKPAETPAAATPPPPAPAMPPAPPVVSNVPPQPVEPPKRKSSFVPVLMAVLFLVIGLGGGFYVKAYQVSKQPPKVVQAPEPQVSVPAGAILVQQCADHKGTLYARPSDIPVGPIFMVNAGKVIGIEYMLDKNQFLANQSFKNLSGEKIKVDHANIGLFSSGHQGFTSPHYHVDLYAVPTAEEESISCPKS